MTPPSRIVLLAGSSVCNTYLPEEQRHHRVLQKALEAHYGEGTAEVRNWADNGEYIARFLLRGTYERLRKETPGADLFILRYALNDAKRMGPEEFGRHNERLIDLLGEDFPGARFIMETGLYLDYPAHYRNDRNQQINPYWEEARAVARRRGFPLNDLYKASEAATRQGRWDLRIRNQRVKPVVVDASRDAEFGPDPDWFTDVHPNPDGVRLAVETQVALLTELFPKALPSGGQKADRPERPVEEYCALLDYSLERLEQPPIHNPDQYQAPAEGH